MDEECDFDMLAAILEEDCGEHIEENNAEVHDGSSDDDIDDEELDKLAGLIQDETKDENKVETDVGFQAIAEQESEKEELKPSTDDKSSDADEEDVQQKDDAVENGDDEDEDDSAVQEKISQMYAMIQQLQSQVSKKAKKRSPAAAASKEQTNETSNKPKSPAVKTGQDTKPGSVQNKNKSSSAGKMKLIDDDIFSKSTPEPSSTKESKNSEKTKGNAVKKDESERSEILYNVKQAQQQIFGSESDDSDWEGLDGEKPDQYNKSGKEIKQIIKKQEKTRVANSPSYDVSKISNRKPTWGLKDVYKPRTPAEGYSSSKRSDSSPRSSLLPRTDDDDDKNVMVDSFSELRIVNPRISSTQLKMRMEGRTMFQMSSLHRRVNTADMQKDWVTIGVLVQKSEPKVSAKGSNYSIWTLSDLKDCQNVVKIFLFGDVHTTHWKTSVGSVLGFLNPNPMSNNEKYQNKSEDVTLSVDIANKIMLMGQSKDFGFCRSLTKAGRKCTNFINKYKSEFCEYHVSQAYKTASSKRGDLQGVMGGIVPKNHKPNLKAKVLASNNEMVFYQGQSFSSSNSKPKKKAVTLNSLQIHEVKKGPLKRGQISTLSLYELRPEDAAKLEKYEEKKMLQDKKAFHDLLATPTVGSMNLVKHLMGDANKEQKKGITFQSVTAQDMFKSRAKMAKKGFSAVGSQSSVTSLPSTSKGLPSLNIPQLGRGLNSNSVLLESPTKNKPSTLTSADMLKKRAIEKIKKQGGVKAKDPNAVKSKIDDNKQERIKKRLCEDSDAENDKNSGNTQAKKKPRLMGGIDLEDPEIQKLLKKKSKHDNLLLDIEQEKQDEYFDFLEKTEKMETKMGEIREINVKAVSCKKCGYTSFKAADRCREERHPLITHDAMKRFFVCQHCNFRTCSLDRLPKTNCKCGKNSWQKTSMFKEKKGPKLETEELNLRGEELKFLNSLQ